MIREFQAGDEVSIVEIYNHYIQNTLVTFEIDALDASQMRQRIEGLIQDYPWYVYEDNGQVMGYAYARQFHPRAAYLHTVETSVYVRNDCLGQGVGRRLYTPLMAHLSAHQCHVALAAIALPNAASVGLHEALGFEKVGHFSQVGRKFNEWIDVGYWQFTFE